MRVLLLERAGAILLEKRPDAGIWGGLWSLPEIDLATDVARHCKARFLADVVVGDELDPIEHGFTHYQLTIHPQRVAVRQWPRARGSAGTPLAHARRCARGRAARADQEAAAPCRSAVAHVALCD